MPASSRHAPGTVQAPFGDAEYPEFPYPGARPDCSFVHIDGVGYPVLPDAVASSGWRVVTNGNEVSYLDTWLERQAAAPLEHRYPVLAYGSNACPQKITWLRTELGLTGPAVVMRARCIGLAAVWSAGYRPRDGQRPAVLAAEPGVVEQHMVWFVTPEQRRVLDRCEGRGSRYRLVRLREPSDDIRLDNGLMPHGVLAYSAAGHDMAPLLVGGRPVRCSQLDQKAAANLTGTPATSDGIACTEITGEP